MLYHNESWLREKYWSENLSTRQIGELVGKDKTTILEWMEKYGIPRRTISEATSGGEEGSIIDVDI